MACIIKCHFIHFLLAKYRLRDVGKTVAVGALGVSFLDVCDVVDINGDEGSVAYNNTAAVDEVKHIEVENSSDHNVAAHWVDGHWRDGQWIEGYWRDGDGDTNVNTNDGYTADNPNYRIPVENA